MSSLGRAALLVVGSLASALLILNQSDPARFIPGQRHDSSVLVEDRASLLSPAQRSRIAEYHTALRDAHDVDYRVATLTNGTDINLDAYRYFEGSGVGELSRAGRGLLLVVDRARNRVRLEVSTSLEGVYTDAFVAYVQSRQMVPFFRTGRVAEGILATTELIVTRAQEAEAGNAFLPPMEAASMGAGATAPAEIGWGPGSADELSRQTHRIEVAGLGPRQVVELYHAAMARRDSRPDLALFSAETVRMLREWTMTPAQMDNVARTYAACDVEAVRADADLAVVRYPAEHRQCAPYFLRRENGAWKLDLTFMSSLIAFNHNNEWRVRAPIPDQYLFAFEGWRFDRKGFAHTVE